MKTTTTNIDVSSIESITHREAPGLAREEYRRFAELLSLVGDDEWVRPTDCEGWTIRDLGGHVVGAMRSAASMREMLRQQKQINRRVKADGGSEVDHMTGLQVELTAALSPAELVAECRSLVEPAARGRKRTPWPARKLVRFPVQMGTIDETWTLGYLVDVILTRDIWMHRVDLARALGRAVELDGHDARLVADVVAEWSRRHGEPVELVLRGPGGGHFLAGSGGARIELDPIEFCRTVSGRVSADGLLSTQVPF